MSTPYPPHGGHGGHNYPGGYGPPPGGDPGYGAPSGPYPGQAPQGPPPPPQQSYPQQGFQQPNPYQNQYPPQPYQQGYGGGGASSDDRTMGLIIHLGGLLLGFLLPLVLYLMKKDESAWVRHHAAQAFNFQMTMFIGYMVSSILMILFIGFILLPIVVIVAIIFGILAALAANKGEWYTYPFTIPMLK